jgi:hypothetical protein
MEDHKTRVTSEFIFTDAEGVYRGMVGLYALERDFVRTGDQSSTIINGMFDGATDILMYRGGGDNGTMSNENLNPENAVIQRFWTQRYELIGRCNEIIDACETRMDLSDAQVGKAWATAKLFRARCYFDLVRRFDNIPLNTRTSSIGNMERVYVAAKQSDVFALITDDLDDAIGADALGWTPSTVGSTLLYGEMTKAVAMHVRAQVALWLRDWDKATECVDEVFAHTEYGMMPSAIECFRGADLNSKEVLYAYQFSASSYGGGELSNETPPKMMGHRMSAFSTNDLRDVKGVALSAEYGGFGCGRIYPNTYLLGLYDQAKDKRYKEMFHYWQDYKYNNPATLPAGKNIGDPITRGDVTGAYEVRLHPMSMKYYDCWTNIADPAYTSSFKDIVVYRLAETALIGAEAYMMKYGGSDTRALAYYNKTWERAGNDAETMVTIEKLLDENARELHFEGTRFYMLKRLGIYASQAVRYGGNTTAENPELGASYVRVRNSTTDRNATWPIPKAELDGMNASNEKIGVQTGVDIPVYVQNPNW